MKKINIIHKISQESIGKMVPCFKPIYKRYRAGETILSYSYEEVRKVALLKSGAAKLEILNSDGEAFLIEYYSSGDIFGEFFSLPIENYEYIVTAIQPCEVIYIDYEHIIRPCVNLCEHHSQLISNLFIMSAQKAQELSLHISILSQSNIRNKLMAYLNYARGVSPTDNDGFFRIPMKLVDLAKYLHVDRSAMMREIRQMKADGIIDGKSRMFKLL